MKRILVDTDVILDFFFDRKPYSDFTAIIFTLCEEKRIYGFVTPVIISNVYYLLRKTARHEKVIEKLLQLLLITDVLTMDRNIVLQALNSGFKDFEDALQHSSAVNDGTIDAIITRNIKDFRQSEIAVMTPEDFLTTLTI
ncbi:MAG: PIN domain-containing protein [Bacteroidetes bacterium]|nr:PIN domain-containing protein [Bacteroidota bacterium]